MRVKEKIDTYRTDKLTCPYCGHEDSDSSYVFQEFEDEEAVECKCDECEKKFIGAIDRCGCGDGKYTSRKISCEEKGRSHEWKHKERKTKTYNFTYLKVSGMHNVINYKGEMEYKWCEGGKHHSIAILPESDRYEQDFFDCCRCDSTKTVDLDKDGNPIPKEKYVHKEELPLPDDAVLKISFHDATMSIWLDETQGSYTIFKPLYQMLDRYGFNMRANPQFSDRKQWGSFTSKRHRKGKKDHLHLKASVSGRHIELQFYQNIIIEEGRESGEYGFNNRKRMPYIIEKQMQVTWNRITSFLQKKYTCEIKEEDLSRFDGELYIVNDTRCSNPLIKKLDGKELASIDGQLEDGFPSYNGKDDNDKPLLNGDFKYYRDSKGYLKRGKVYHKTGNMWYSLHSSGYVDINSASTYFDLTEDTPRKEHKSSVGEDHVRKIKGILSHHEKEQNYERCVSVRDYLKKLEDENKA